MSGMFSGKVVVITGAARGIGRNIASRFAVTGALVAVVDRDKDSGSTTVRDLQALGHSAVFVQGDLVLRDVPASIIKKIVLEHGRIDVLVNNARARGGRDFLQETPATWDESVNVGLRAALFASQAAIREMGARGGGVIVNISSIAGLMATHESPSYHAAKAGLIQLTRYLAVCAGSAGVRVNCVCPGFIVQDEHRTRFESSDNTAYRADANAIHPLRQVGTANDVADAVLFLSSPQAAFVNGHVLVLDGGATLIEQFGLIRASRED
jgi:NAD(P)-dependent dehydrogenase (short-subunit alcohol dehydrogenase family)